MYGGGVMPGWRAGSGFGKYNAESPKQGRKRFNFITKMIHFSHLGILFIYDRDSDYFWYSVRTYKKTAYTGYMY